MATIASTTVSSATFYPIDGVEYYAEDAALYTAARSSGIGSDSDFSVLDFSYDSEASTISMTIGPGGGCIHTGTFEGRMFAFKENMATFTINASSSGEITVCLRYKRDGGDEGTGTVIPYVSTDGAPDNEATEGTDEDTDGDGDLANGLVGQWDNYYLVLYTITIPSSCDGVTEQSDGSEDDDSSHAYYSDYRGTSKCPIMADPLKVQITGDTELYSEDVVLGTQATNTGTEGANVCIGYATTTSSNCVAIANGAEAEATGKGAVAIGSGASALSAYNVAIGYSPTADFYDSHNCGGPAVAIGYYSSAEGFGGVAVGNSCTADDGHGVAIGSRCKAGAYSVGLGGGLKTATRGALASYSVAIGSQACAWNSDDLGAVTDFSGSVAIGNEASATGAGSVALGEDSIAYGNNAFALGGGAEAGQNSVAFSDEITTFNADGVEKFNVQEAVIYCVGTYQTSDARDKINVESLDGDALAAVNELRPVQYNYNKRRDYVNKKRLTRKQREELEKYGLTEYDREAWAEGEKAEDKKRTGLIAQEAEKTLNKYFGQNSMQVVKNSKYGVDDYPENVEDVYDIDYSALVPILIKAIQELSEQVDNLEKIVNAEINDEAYYVLDGKFVEAVPSDEDDLFMGDEEDEAEADEETEAEEPETETEETEDTTAEESEETEEAEKTEKSEETEKSEALEEAEEEAEETEEEEAETPEVAAPESEEIEGATANESPADEGTGEAEDSKEASNSDEEDEET